MMSSSTVFKDATKSTTPPRTPLPPQDTTFLDIDDENDERENIASIDTAHQFLNFSRKVTEASSMRKPVDIQLGIAFGKDLMFNSSSRLSHQRHQRQLSPHNINNKPALSNKSSLSKHLDRNTTNDITTATPPPSPPTTSLEKRVTTTGNNEKKNEGIPTATNKKINDINTSREVKHRSLPLQKHYNNSNNSNNNSMLASTNSVTSSPLLDRLVADVLSHIESCPDHSAYSDDLDRLKPKLQAYSITRLPPSLKSS